LEKRLRRSVSAAVLVACMGNGGVETPGGQAGTGIQEIVTLVQARNNRRGASHRLLHVIASDIAPDNPELSQQLDNTTEEL